MADSVAAPCLKSLEFRLEDAETVFCFPRGEHVKGWRELPHFQSIATGEPQGTRPRADPGMDEHIVRLKPNPGADAR